MQLILLYSVHIQPFYVHYLYLNSSKLTPYYPYKQCLNQIFQCVSFVPLLPNGYYWSLYKYKVFVFKTSLDLPRNDVDHVKRMQVRGDMKNSWIIFCHVKRLKDLTTLACHVYDNKYCKVLLIAFCDMQSTYRMIRIFSQGKLG